MEWTFGKDTQVPDIRTRLGTPHGIVMECSGLHTHNKRSECPGLNALVMSYVANYPAFRERLQVTKTMLMGEVRAKRLQDPDDVPLLDVITVCRDGFHRPVACAELLAFVLLQRGWHVHVEHMHQEFWGWCKGDCRKCLSCEHARAEALEYALTTWRRV